jgi:hypothetical protein
MSAAPLPPGRTRRTDWLRCSGDPCVCDKPGQAAATAEQTVADLLALVAVFEAKEPAWRHIPTRLIRALIEDGAR